jgi:FMN phosphatase YigB (HAD superfamily)
VIQPIIDSVTAFRPYASPGWVAQLCEALYKLPLDLVKIRLELTEEEFAAAFRAYRELTLPDDAIPSLFDDAVRALADILRLRDRQPVLRFGLMTRGFRKLQTQKIRAHNLTAYFHEVYIDALDDGPNRPGQAAHLRALSAKWDMPPEQFLVVGDDPLSELSAAEQVGMPNVLVARHSDASDSTERHRIVRNIDEVTSELCYD